MDVFLIDGSKQCNNLIIRRFNFRGCLSSAKTAKKGPPRIIPAIRYHNYTPTPVFQEPLKFITHGRTFGRDYGIWKMSASRLLTVNVLLRDCFLPTFLGKLRTYILIHYTDEHMGRDLADSTFKLNCMYVSQPDKSCLPVVGNTSRLTLHGE